MPTKRPSMADLNKYARRGGRACGICASPHRKFIDQAIAAGHSKRAVREYMAAEFDVQLPTLNNHVTNHVAKKA